MFRFSAPPPGMVSFQYITSKTGPVIINLTANRYLESANNLQAKGDLELKGNSCNLSNRLLTLANWIGKVPNYVLHQ